jgi:hypothetical protein
VHEVKRDQRGFHRRDRDRDPHVGRPAEVHPRHRHRDERQEDQRGEHRQQQPRRHDVDMRLVLVDVVLRRDDFGFSRHGVSL